VRRPRAAADPRLPFGNWDGGRSTKHDRTSAISSCRDGCAFSPRGTEGLSQGFGCRRLRVPGASVGPGVPEHRGRPEGHSPVVWAPRRNKSRLPQDHGDDPRQRRPDCPCHRRPARTRPAVSHPERVHGPQDRLYRGGDRARAVWLIGLCQLGFAVAESARQHGKVAGAWPLTPRPRQHVRRCSSVSDS
jgi:hypothetical protein